MQLVEYNDMEKDWVERFLGSHLKPANVEPRSIGGIRFKDTSPE